MRSEIALAAMPKWMQRGGVAAIKNQVMNLPKPPVFNSALAEQLKRIGGTVAPTMQFAKAFENAAKPTRLSDIATPLLSASMRRAINSMDDYMRMGSQLPSAFDSLHRTIAGEASRMAGLSESIARIKAGTDWVAPKMLESFVLSQSIRSSALYELNDVAARMTGSDAVHALMNQNQRSAISGILKRIQAGSTFAAYAKALEPDLRIASLVKDFKSSAATRDAARWAKWTESLKMPTLDLAASAAIARVWGAQGMRRQLELLDVEESAIEVLVPAFADPAQQTGARGDLMSRQVGRISLANWVAIISALFALWVYMDSLGLEKKIDAMQDGATRADQRLVAIQSLLQNALAQSRVQDDFVIEFVVRSRVSLIRRAGKHGSAVVAEALPNQTVELLSEDGKWILVRYFDWNAHEERTGWALKKYFKRIERTPRK